MKKKLNKDCEIGDILYDGCGRPLGVRIYGKDQSEPAATAQPTRHL